ncbi:MAG: hypothetical protein AUI10_09295 [Actinobacteria bacterium 13_2_20CM_2_72_6]|nr:MAG: hypothetical protein AUI10_09295 [Actinobacteria bacterium 13_2_20CM_2_72_6]
MMTPNSAQTAAPATRTTQKLRWMPPLMNGAGLPRMLMLSMEKKSDISHPATYPPIAQKATKPRSSRPA